jgi:integrase
MEGIMVPTPFDRIKSLWTKLTETERRDLLAFLSVDPDGEKTKKSRDRDGLYKRGRVWWLCYTVKGQKRRESAKTGDKEVARDLLAKRRKEEERRRLGLPIASRMTFTKLADDYLASPVAKAKRSRDRDTWCMAQLKARFGDFLLDDVDRTKVEAYQRERLAEGVSPATINRAIALLRVTLNHAVESGQIDANPIARVKMLREAAARRPKLEPDDEAKLIDACSPEWMRLLVRILLATGCRVGEVLALTFGDIDFARGSLIIRMSKSGESREVPLNATILGELRERRAAPAAFVIVKPDKKRPTLSGAGQAFRRALEKVRRDEGRDDRADLRIHDLRHVFSARMIERGMSLFELSKILGHKTPIVTTRYPDITMSRVRSLMDAGPETARSARTPTVTRSAKKSLVVSFPTRVG